MPVGVDVRLAVRLHRGVPSPVRLTVEDAVPVAVGGAVPDAVAYRIPLIVGVRVDDAVRV